MSRLSAFPWFSAATIFLSITGLVFPPLALVALGLGFFAISKARSPGAKRLAQAGVALSFAGLAVVGALLLARRGQAGDSGAECQIGLKALSAAQDAHRKSRGRYASSSEELGVPVGQQYFLSTAGENEGVLAKLHVGQSGQCPECKVTMACREAPAGTWWTITSGSEPLRVILER